MTGTTKTLIFCAAGMAFCVAWTIGCVLFGYPLGAASGIVSAIVCALCAADTWSLRRYE